MKEAERVQMADRTAPGQGDNAIPATCNGDHNYQALLLNNIREAMVVWDLDGRITFWNPAAYILYGWTAAERLGQRVEEGYFQMFSPCVVQPGEENTGGFEVERQCRTKRGETIWVSARTTALRETRGSRQIIGYMDLARNITRSKREQQALKDSQHFVQRILDTSPNLIFIFDLHLSQVAYINHEVNSILGFSADELKALDITGLKEMVHPEDLPLIFEHFRRLFSTRENDVAELEYRMKTRDHAWRWFFCRVTVFQRAPDGSPSQIIGAAQDITERKHAEEALHHQLDTERLIATIATHLNNYLPDQIDPGIADSLCTVSDFIGADFSYVFLFPDDNQTGLTAHAWWSDQSKNEIFLKQKIYLKHMPWIRSRLNQFEFYHLIDVADIPDTAGEVKRLLAERNLRSTLLIPLKHGGVPIGFMGFGSHQEEKAWEEKNLRLLKTLADIFVNALIHRWSTIALHESEARYRAIVDDHQTEMIYRALPDGTLTFVNETYCRYFGKNRDELVGSNFLAVVSPEDREDVREKFARLCKVRPTQTYENRIQLPGGEIRWHEWTDRAIFDHHGHFIEFQSVGRDITERKQMEAEIQSAQARLAQQGRLAAIGELAASVAHQINNPLTTIIGEAQLLLQDRKRAGSERDSVEAIEKAGWRAQKVVQELMEFSRPAVDTLESISINQTIEQALILVGAHIEANGVKLCVDLGKDLPHVRGNLRQFENLWVNLLLVARASTADCGSHSINIRTASVDRQSIWIEVIDGGKVISEAELETIFEPGLSPSGRGSGIELSICREIVRQNHGSISVRSCELGTTFSIIIPVED